MAKDKLGSWWAAGAAVCLLVSAGVAAQERPAAGTDSPFNERGGPNQAILTHLHQENAQAIVDARMAEQRSTNAEVKGYARQIIDAHTAANARIVAYAQQEGMNVAAIQGGAGAQPHGSLTRVDLTTAAPDRFDYEFANKMVADHQAAYDEMQKATALARGARLRTLLRELTPGTLQGQAGAMALVAALPAPPNPSLPLPAPVSPVLPLPGETLGGNRAPTGIAAPPAGPIPQ